MIKKLNKESEQGQVDTFVIPQEFKDLNEEKRQYYFDKAAELLADLYYCKRVWTAWGHGTMRPDDFILASEDDEIINAVAESLYEERKKEAV